MIALLIAGFIASGTATAQAEWWDDEGVTCRYVEAGPAGPRGNALQIDLGSTTKGIVLHRNGFEVQAFVVLGIHNWREDAFPLGCSGVQATVRNIDRVALLVSGRSTNHLVINQSGGPVPQALDPDSNLPGGILGPGATPERRGSEIEIGVFGQSDGGFAPGAVLVVGKTGNDRISVGNFRGEPTINLNGGTEQGAEDFDIWPMPKVAGIAIHSVAGDDLVFGRGGDGLAPLGPAMPLWVNGGPGRDRLLGHQGLDRMHGGSGPDLIRGLGGNDNNPGVEFGLTGGPGRDRVYGGTGNDFIGGVNNATTDWGSDWVYGGPGRDEFVGSADRSSDLIDCGPGRDGQVQHDRIDRLRRCEMD